MGAATGTGVYGEGALIRRFKHNEMQIEAARRAFYALCTHIDHQIRLIVGTLREESLLDDTIIMFTADHGDMLGNHNQSAKPSSTRTQPTFR